MYKIILILILFIVNVTLISCEKQTNDETEAIYHKIEPGIAKKMMEESSVIILDVRTSEEYNEGHIPGAVLIPDYEILETAEKVLKDKNQTILVYCRSGNRSRKAANNLLYLGYQNVYDFGGIIDWPYEIVKGKKLY